MKSYWIKTPAFIKRLFNNQIWDIPNSENKIYLTFDDGPTPKVTEWVLYILKMHNIKATFFCIGKNIEKYPEIFKMVISEGHSIGNHTFNHVNGWRTNSYDYLKNAALCQSTITNQQLPINNLFRPPYGKIKSSQSKKLRRLGYKIIMWDVLSADFDQTISKEQSLENATKKAISGSIIVFHDSQKALKNIEYALPKTIEILKEKGYQFDSIR